MRESARLLSRRAVARSARSARFGILWSTVASVVLPGCGLTPAPPLWRVELETKQVSVVAPGAPGGDSLLATDLSHGEFLTGARETLWICEEAVASRASSVARVVAGDQARQERVSSSGLLERSTGEVWRSVGGALPWPVSGAALSHRRANRRRRSRLDLVSLLFEHPDGAGSADLSEYSGADRLTLRVVSDRGRRKRTRVSTEPGARWEILSAAGKGDETPPWLATALCEHVLGVERSVAERIANATGGLPVSFVQEVVPEGGTRLLTRTDVVAIRSRPGETTPFQIAPAARARARALRAELEGEEAIFSFLSSFEDRPERAPDPIELILALETRAREGRAGPRFLDRVESAWAAARSFDLRVELIRLALRIDPEGTEERLAEPPSGEIALAAAEAWIAEERPGAARRVLDVIERSREIPGADPAALVLWGLRHLRVLSGLSPRELRDRLPPFPSGSGRGDRTEGKDSPSPRYDLLLLEVDFWETWWRDREPPDPAVS